MRPQWRCGILVPQSSLQAQVIFPLGDPTSFLRMKHLRLHQQSRSTPTIVQCCLISNLYLFPTMYRKEHSLSGRKGSNIVTEQDLYSCHARCGNNAAWPK